MTDSYVQPVPYLCTFAFKDIVLKSIPASIVERSFRIRSGSDLRVEVEFASWDPKDAENESDVERMLTLFQCASISKEVDSIRQRAHLFNFPNENTLIMSWLHDRGIYYKSPESFDGIKILGSSIIYSIDQDAFFGEDTEPSMFCLFFNWNEQLQVIAISAEDDPTQPNIENVRSKVLSAVGAISLTCPTEIIASSTDIEDIRFYSHMVKEDISRESLPALQFLSFLPYQFQNTVSPLYRAMRRCFPNITISEVQKHMEMAFYNFNSFAQIDEEDLDEFIEECLDSIVENTQDDDGSEIDTATDEDVEEFIKELENVEGNDDKEEEEVEDEENEEDEDEDADELLLLYSTFRSYEGGESPASGINKMMNACLGMSNFNQNSSFWSGIHIFDHILDRLKQSGISWHPAMSSEYWKNSVKDKTLTTKVGDFDLNKVPFWFLLFLVPCTMHSWNSVDEDFDGDFDAVEDFSEKLQAHIKTLTKELNA